MTKDEWAALSYATFGEWWDAPQSDERIDAWFPELERYDVDRVLDGLRKLLRSSPTFAPKLGELLKSLMDDPPAWEVAWRHTVRALRHLPDQRAVVKELAETAGPLVAGWVATYGPQRLGHEPTLDPDHGGAVIQRLTRSYIDSTSSMSSQQHVVQELLRSLDGLPPSEIAQIEAGFTAVEQADRAVLLEKSVERGVE